MANTSYDYLLIDTVAQNDKLHMPISPLCQFLKSSTVPELAAYAYSISLLSVMS